MRTVRVGERVLFGGVEHVVTGCPGRGVHDGRIVIKAGHDLRSVRPSQLDATSKKRFREPADDVSTSASSEEEIKAKPKKTRLSPAKGDERRRRQQKKGEDNVPKKTKKTKAAADLLNSRSARRAYRETRGAIEGAVDAALAIYARMGLSGEESARATRLALRDRSTPSVLDGGGRQAMRTLRKGGMSDDEIATAVGLAAGKPPIDDSMVFRLPRKDWVAR